MDFPQVPVGRPASVSSACQRNPYARYIYASTFPRTQQAAAHQTSAVSRRIIRLLGHRGTHR